MSKLYYINVLQNYMKIYTLNTVVFKKRKISKIVHIYCKLYILELYITKEIFQYSYLLYFALKSKNSKKIYTLKELHVDVVKINCIAKFYFVSLSI